MFGLRREIAENAQEIHGCVKIKNKVQKQSKNKGKYRKTMQELDKKSEIAENRVVNKVNFVRGKVHEVAKWKVFAKTDVRKLQSGKFWVWKRGVKCVTKLQSGKFRFKYFGGIFARRGRSSGEFGAFPCERVF